MTRIRLVWAGVGLGTLFWFLEGAIHASLFVERSVVNAIFAPDPHEIWMRSCANSEGDTLCQPI